MTFKQPRVPQMREGAQLAAYIRELALFLKDFCLESWMQSKRREEELHQIRKEIETIKDEMGLK